MKKFFILSIIIILWFNSSIVDAKEYYYKNKVYERFTDSKNKTSGIRVNFYQIDYLKNKILEKEINYILEKFSFEIVYTYLKYFYKLYSNKNIEFKNVLYWIDNLENESFSFEIWSNFLENDDIFKLGYIDENIINIYYLAIVNGVGIIKEKDYEREYYSYFTISGSLVLDINTKEKIRLSDLIEIDKRLFEYKIGDGITDYDLDMVTQYKSFKDAFRIYTNDKEKDNDHDRTLDEVIEELKNNEHTWYLDKDKNLTFILYASPKQFTEFKIDYEFIKPLLKDKYKYL